MEEARETSTFSWAELRLTGDPRLVVGWRRGKRLGARRIELHEETFPVLREISRDALNALARMEGRPFEPYAALEIGEQYFAVTVDELPERPPPRRNREELEEDGVADLVRLMRDVDELDFIPSSAINDHKYTFYAICWRSSGRTTAFIRKTSPRVSLKRGQQFFQYGQTLRSVEAPDLVLDHDVDIAIHGDVIAVIRPSAFRQLLADVRLAISRVATYVDSIVALLSTTMPLSSESSEALKRVGSSRMSYASRLCRLQDRLAALTLDPTAMREAAQEHIDEVDKVVDPDGVFVFDDERVPIFLDFVEGRLYEDDATGEHRRADRWSSR